MTKKLTTAEALKRGNAAVERAFAKLSKLPEADSTKEYMRRADMLVRALDRRAALFNSAQDTRPI